MRDLVDRSRVMNDLFEAHPIGFNNDDIADAFKNAPCVYAVEVVRCKDCKHWGIGYGGETEHVKACCFASYMVGENGYCVYGERKADEEVER